MNSGTQGFADSVTQPSGPKGLVQFGLFELNMQTGELRKSGVRVRLQGKPFQILQALLERPGAVVTREELRKRLWPADTFVDFESGLNTAANRLRLTLGDSAENPRYIQTLSRSGYRFIASVSEAVPRQEVEIVAEPAVPIPAADTSVELPVSALATPLPTHASKRWLIGIGVTSLAILLVGVTYLTGRKSGSETTFRQITFRRGYIDQARFAPDGQTVLYGAHWNGEPSTISMVSPESPESRSLGFNGFELMSISKSGELILTRKRASYRVPMNGGSPKLFLDGVSASDWTPQGDIALVRQESGEAKLEFPRGKPVFRTAGYISHMRVSPRGDAVAFLEHPMTMDDGGNVVWVDSAGTAHRISEGWASAGGLAWSPDGKEIWFTASRNGLNRSLYAATRNGPVRLVAGIPGNMTLHDISPRGEVVLSRDTLREVMLLGKEDGEEKDVSWFDWSQPADLSPDGRYLLFNEGGEGGGREYAVYIRDLSSGSTTKISDGEGFAFFPDSKSILTMLPRENNRLNVVPVGAGQTRIIDWKGSGFSYQWAQVFPDGRKLLVNGSMPGQGLRLYTQSIDGGPLTPLNPEATFDVPRISPDGTRIAAANRSHKIVVIPAAGGKPEILPVNTMAVPVKWSTDGNRLLLRTDDGAGSSWLEWMDLKSGKTVRWKKLNSSGDGNEGLDATIVSRDERTYVYAAQRRLSELFLADGWR